MCDIVIWNAIAMCMWAHVLYTLCRFFFFCFSLYAWYMRLFQWVNMCVYLILYHWVCLCIFVCLIECIVLVLECLSVLIACIDACNWFIFYVCLFRRICSELKFFLFPWKLQHTKASHVRFFFFFLNWKRRDFVAQDLTC